MCFNSGVISYSALWGERGGKSGKQSASVLVCATPQLSPQYACSSSTVLEKGWNLEQLHLHNESV